MTAVTEEECALVARIGVRSGEMSRHLQSGKVRRIVEFFGDGETWEGKSLCVYGKEGVALKKGMGFRDTWWRCPDWKWLWFSVFHTFCVWCGWCVVVMVVTRGFSWCWIFIRSTCTGEGWGRCSGEWHWCTENRGEHWGCAQWLNHRFRGCAEVLAFFLSFCSSYGIPEIANGCSIRILITVAIRARPWWYDCNKGC